jgi:hypothetical protein
MPARASTCSGACQAPFPPHFRTRLPCRGLDPDDAPHVTLVKGISCTACLTLLLICRLGLCSRSRSVHAVTVCNMALPKSMRYLAAATVCIFVYLFLQILHAPQTEIHLPTSKLPGLKYSNTDREPQLDRQ